MICCHIVIHIIHHHVHDVNAQAATAHLFEVSFHIQFLHYPLICCLQLNQIAPRRQVRSINIQPVLMLIPW